MKKNINKKLIITIAIMILFALTIPVFADVGNLNRYSSNDSDSDFDFGGGGSGDILDILYLVRILFMLGTPGKLILAAILVVIGIYVVKSIRSHGTAADNIINYTMPKQNTSNPVPRNYSLTEVLKADPTFSEEKFKGWVSEVFIKLQNAWSARDWKIARAFESNELFNMHKSQIDQFIAQGRINVVDRVAVTKVDLINYKVENGREILVVELSAVMKDYIIDEKTKEVVEGNKEKDWHMRYNLTFERKQGIKTSSTSNKSTTNCPNCGAPIEVNAAGMCAYCGTVVTSGDHDWVMTSITSID